MNSHWNLRGCSFTCSCYGAYMPFTYIYPMWWFTNLFIIVWRSSECHAMITAGQNLPDHLIQTICHDIRKRRLVKMVAWDREILSKYRSILQGWWMILSFFFVTTWLLAPIYSYPFLPSVTMQDFVKAYLAYKKELLNWHSAAASENHYHHKPFGVEMEHFTS